MVLHFFCITEPIARYQLPSIARWMAIPVQNCYLSNNINDETKSEPCAYLNSHESGLLAWNTGILGNIRESARFWTTGEIHFIFVNIELSSKIYVENNSEGIDRRDSLVQGIV